ncbi:hypothetical protein CL619_04890 [archaeon]|nr:hypothetical protein [archaeon]|tara:strand:- start:6 stop:320 length:315 start_codon:yes stop_codon:yes gene_type:complete
MERTRVIGSLVEIHPGYEQEAAAFYDTLDGLNLDATITSDSRMIEDLGIDSIDTLEIEVELEYRIPRLNSTGDGFLPGLGVNNASYSITDCFTELVKYLQEGQK